MNATFDVEDDRGEETVLSVISEAAADWGDGKTGAVELSIAHERNITLILRKSEARAIASALMGAAAEL